MGEPAPAGAQGPAADDPAPASDPGSGAAAGEKAPVEGGASGNVEGEPFVVRGVLAHRIASPKIEVRLFSGPVRCERFDDDYALAEDEKVVVVILEWPKEAGETIALSS